MICCMQHCKRPLGYRAAEALDMAVHNWFTVALVAAGMCLAAPAPTPEVQLADAVKNGDAAAVKSLLAKKADVNAAAADSSTPLDWAVDRNNLEIADLLLGAGANVNGATRYKITPLALASANGNAAMIERLVQAGADANTASRER